MLAPLDFFATRHGRFVSVIEVKCRSHASDTYPTVFLNVRKWLALGLAQVGLGVRALFVVEFTDQIKFIRWDAVGADKVRIGGCSTRVTSHADIEPVIEVEVEQMLPLADSWRRTRNLSEVDQ